VRAEETVLRAAMDDPSPIVQATAVVGLVAGGWVSDDAQAALDALFQESSHEARAALAQAIERQPTPAFESILLDLGNDPDHEIQRSVAHALGALRSERALPTLLSMLQATATRAAARQALLAFGDPALGFLAESLVDTTLPQELRRHVPRTISLFPADQAAPILLGRLLEERDGMVRFKILRGLGRLAASNPTLKLDAAILRTATDQTVEVAFRLRYWRGLLEQGAREDRRRATPGHHLLATLLRDKERHTVERLFRFIGLQYRGEDFARIYHGLGNSNPKVRASSRELLENLIRPPLRDAVLVLIGDAAASQRLLESPDAAPRDLGYESLLGLLLEQPGETLRCIAAYHVGELRLGGLRGRIEALRAQETGLFVSRIFERTLRLISQPETGALHAG
jgi:HEAT repeat protein